MVLPFSGPFIMIGCKTGEIEIYQADRTSIPVFITKVTEKPIYHIEIMSKKNILLAKTGRNDLEFFSLPYFSGKSWVYNMKHLRPILENFSNEFLCEQNFR